MACWRKSNDKLEEIVSDGMYQRKNTKVSYRDVQEWSLQMRENKLILDEFNIRKKQSQVQTMIGFKDSRGKSFMDSFESKTLSKGNQKDDKLAEFENALIDREKSIKEEEKVLDDMMVFYNASFDLTNPVYEDSRLTKEETFNSRSSSVTNHSYEI